MTYTIATRTNGDKVIVARAVTRDANTDERKKRITDGAAGDMAGAE